MRRKNTMHHALGALRSTPRARRLAMGRSHRKQRRVQNAGLSHRALIRYRPHKHANSPTEKEKEKLETKRGVTPVRKDKLGNTRKSSRARTRFFKKPLLCTGMTHQARDTYLLRRFEVRLRDVVRHHDVSVDIVDAG